MSELAPAGTAAPAAPAISPEAAAAALVAAQPVVAPAAAPQAAPVAPVVAPQVAPVAPVAAAPAQAPATGQEPPWAIERLQRAKQTGQSELLAQLGVANIEEARAAVTAQRAKVEAEKTAEQRLAENTTRLAAAEAVIVAQATNMMAALTDDQRASVASFIPQMRAMGAAGSDHQLQLAAINALASNWIRPAATAPLAAAPVVAPAATTSPAPGAPPGVAPGSPPDPRALYTAARAVNPFAAAVYGAAHPSVYQAKQ